MSKLQVVVLGKPATRWNGRDMRASNTRVRALLYRLAAQSEPIPYAHLGFLFWSEQSEDGMRRNVTRLCNQLQRTLPIGNALCIDDNGVGLNLSLVWSDAILFQQLAEDYNHTPRLLLLCALVDLYKGPFLDGFSLPGYVEYNAWIDLAQRLWTRDYLAALQTLVEQLIALGDLQRAVTAAQRCLAVDPLDESMHRRLIEIDGALGDYEAAQMQYMACVEALCREQGRSPEAATEAAYRAAMAGDLDRQKIIRPFELHLDFVDRGQGRRQWQYEPTPRRQKILLF